MPRLRAVVRKDRTGGIGIEEKGSESVLLRASLQAVSTDCGTFFGDKERTSCEPAVGLLRSCQTRFLHWQGRAPRKLVVIPLTVGSDCERKKRATSAGNEEVLRADGARILI